MAGFYYDWLSGKWTPHSAVKLTPAQKSRCKLRGDLLSNLVVEIEQGGDGVARLYALLLARTLVATDETLMRDFGQCIAAKHSQENERVTTGIRNHE